MKIMIAIPTLGVGGAEIMVETLLSSLINKAEVVLVIYDFTNSPIEKRLKDLNVRIVGLEKKKGFSLSAMKRVRQIVKNEKPDIIHTHLHALPYFWLASGHISVIHTVHNIAAKEQEGLGKLVCSWIYKHSKKCVPVAISNKIKESLVAEFGKSLKRTCVINNGVKFDGYRPKTNYTSGKQFEIVHVGRFNKVKNHALMIDSINFLADHGYDVHISLIGDGPDRVEIEKKVDELRIQERVSFEGVQENVLPYLEKADLFILPSEYEGMPMSLIEAMGMGMPIIASNVGGIPDLIENEIEGLLIEPTQCELQNAIAELYSNEAKRSLLGINAQKKSYLFSGNQMADSYFNLYGNCISISTQKS